MQSGDVHPNPGPPKKVEDKRQDKRVRAYLGDLTGHVWIDQKVFDTMVNKLNQLAGTEVFSACLLTLDEYSQDTKVRAVYNKVMAHPPSLTETFLIHGDNFAVKPKYYRDQVVLQAKATGTHMEDDEEEKKPRIVFSSVDEMMAATPSSSKEDEDESGDDDDDEEKSSGHESSTSGSHKKKKVPRKKESSSKLQSINDMKKNRSEYKLTRSEYEQFQKWTAEKNKRPPGHVDGFHEDPDDEPPRGINPIKIPKLNQPFTGSLLSNHIECWTPTHKLVINTITKVNRFTALDQRPLNARNTTRLDRDFTTQEVRIHQLAIPKKLDPLIWMALTFFALLAAFEGAFVPALMIAVTAMYVSQITVGDDHRTTSNYVVAGPWLDVLFSKNTEAFLSPMQSLMMYSQLDMPDGYTTAVMNGTIAVWKLLTNPEGYYSRRDCASHTKINSVNYFLVYLDGPQSEYTLDPRGLTPSEDVRLDQGIDPTVTEYVSENSWRFPGLQRIPQIDHAASLLQKEYSPYVARATLLVFLLVLYLVIRPFLATATTYQPRYPVFPSALAEYMGFSDHLEEFSPIPSEALMHIIPNLNLNYPLGFLLSAALFTFLNTGLHSALIFIGGRSWKIGLLMPVLMIFLGLLELFVGYMLVGYHDWAPVTVWATLNGLKVLTTISLVKTKLPKPLFWIISVALLAMFADELVALLNWSPTLHSSILGGLTAAQTASRPILGGILKAWNGWCTDFTHSLNMYLYPTVRRALHGFEGAGGGITVLTTALSSLASVLMLWISARVLSFGTFLAILGTFLTSLLLFLRARITDILAWAFVLF
jgi:hypothetical protein